jgi:hypothetical protein
MTPMLGPGSPGDLPTPEPAAPMTGTTIRMDDALLARAKAEATRTGRTLAR